MSYNKLLDNVSVDTVGQPFQGDGGSKLLVISGTNLGGGSITIELSLDSGVNWAPATYNGTLAIFTAFQSLMINKIAQHAKIRATLSGSTGASGVSVIIAS